MKVPTMKKFKRFLLCTAAALSTFPSFYSSSLLADVVESEGVNFGKLYTNNGIFNPGNVSTVATQRYNTYTENLALKKTAVQSSTLGSFSAGMANDGISYNINDMNFSHTMEDAGTKWWQVNFADTAASISSLKLANRPGFDARLSGFTVSIYDGDPSNGGTLLWTSTAQSTFNKVKTFDALVDSSGNSISSVSGTWLRITNGPTNTTPLTLVEVSIPTGATQEKAGTYGHQAGWIAPDFQNSSSGTLQFDVDAAQTQKTDTLDVSGTFIAGGTLNLNLVNVSGLAAGDYQVIKAGAYAKSFAAVTYTGLSALDGTNIILSHDKMNSEGKFTVSSGVHWKESAANTNFADAANWSGDTAGQTLYYGVYDTASGGAAANASLTTAYSPSGVIYMAQNAGSSATLTVAEGGNLTTTEFLYVGMKGTAVLNQTGGTIQTNGFVYVADQSGSNGSLTLSGGSMTAAGGLVVGARGTAVMNVAAGGNLSATKNDANGLVVGYTSGANGTLNVTGGDVTTAGIQIGSLAGSKGTVNVSAGNLTANAGTNMRVADGGSAVLNQTGGTMIFNCPVYCADGSNSRAELNISGGTLTANSDFTLGTRSAAVMNVSGTADVKLNGGFFLGFGAGNGSNGTLNQSGGSVTVTNAGGVQFGNGGWNSTVVGAYNLSGGTLTAPKMVVSSPVAGKTNVTASFTLKHSGNAVISGELAVPTIMNGGKLQVGTISSTVEQFTGVLTPGGDGSYGTTTITGVYTLHGADPGFVVEPGSNIALGKPTSQVSTYSQTEGDYTPFASANAVDGIYEETAGGRYHIAHTLPSSGSNQWWQVDLGGRTTLDSIKIYGRGADGARLTPFHFEVYDGTNDEIGNLLWKSGTLTGLTGTIFEFNAENAGLEGVTGKVLRIVREFPNGVSGNDNDTLNLLEVEVYGEAAAAVWRMDVKADGSQNDVIFLQNGELNILGGRLELVFDDPSKIHDGSKYQLFNIDDTSTVTGNFDELILPELANGLTWDFNPLTGTLTVNSPEPASWLLLLLGIGAAFRFRTFPSSRGESRLAS